MRYIYKGKEISKARANLMAYGSLALIVGAGIVIYAFMRLVIG